MKNDILDNGSLLKDLCDLYIKQRNIESSIYNLFKGDLIITFNLNDIILDLFNFPKDNTLDCFDFRNQVFINGKNENDLYCRDYLYDIFYESNSGEELYKKLLEENKLKNKYGMTLITIK